MQGWDDYDIDDHGQSDDGGGMWGGDVSDEPRDDGPIMEATFDQQVHSSEQNDCGALIVKEPGKEDEYRKAMSQLDPVDRLKQLIGSIVYSLNDNNVLDVSSQERNEICRSVDNLGSVNLHAKYVSPLAYVLGYVAFHQGLMITDKDSGSKKKEKANKLNRNIFNDLDNINTVTGGANNYAVFPPDVVRYMRLWNRISV
tara:strand:- start:23 stop:619 length:597 start_codon:yes stop_codon:yes gene_type:complete